MQSVTRILGVQILYPLTRTPPDVFKKPGQIFWTGFFHSGESLAWFFSRSHAISFHRGPPLFKKLGFALIMILAMFGSAMLAQSLFQSISSDRVEPVEPDPALNVKKPPETQPIAKQSEATTTPPAPAKPELLPLSEFSRIGACIVTDRYEIPVQLLIADRDELRAQGLQGVSSLPPATGMLFLYQEPRSSESRFWMYGTKMDLDIAYISETGTVVAVGSMDKCNRQAAECPRYQVGVRFKAAMEFPQGFLLQEGIGVGARLNTNQFSACLLPAGVRR